MTVQMKATEQYVNSCDIFYYAVDEILLCDHSNERFSEVPYKLPTF